MNKRQIGQALAWYGLRIAMAMLTFSVGAAALAAEPRTVTYPGFEVAGDVRFLPYVELLQQALKRTEGEYGPAKAVPTTLAMTEARYLKELANGTVDVIWSSATEEREQQFLPVRIPLDKGLLGYRIALISQDRQAAIDRVKTLADLRKLIIGQGLGWGDVALYRANGIRVSEARYESLFTMVSNGRFDLFPRGIGEAFAEYDKFSRANPKLAIEKDLAFYYPWPYYFFFNRNNAALAKRVEEGLRMMIKDGSFDALFQQHYGDSIKRANLSGRRLIRIANPLLPKATPLSDHSLWYMPH
jgi:ABC-type amino acid transport substrate-binding protein